MMIQVFWSIQPITTLRKKIIKCDKSGIIIEFQKILGWAVKK